MQIILSWKQSGPKTHWKKFDLPPSCLKNLCSIAKLYVILCKSMDCSMPGVPAHHQLLEPTQTHVQRVSDANQQSHPLSSPFPPAFNLFQHQGLFQWISSSHQVAKILEFQLQHSSSYEYSGLFSLRMDWLISLQSKGLSRVFSNTRVQKHQYFSTKLSL